MLTLTICQQELEQNHSQWNLNTFCIITIITEINIRKSCNKRPLGARITDCKLDVSKRHEWPRLQKLKNLQFHNTCGHKHDGSLTYQKSAQNLEAYRKKSV